MITTVGVGDVLAVNTGTVFGHLIELGEEMMGEAHKVDHVIIAHHQDKLGTWWGIEGRPGGVGWRELDRYLDGDHVRFDNSNAWQERTAEQRKHIAGLAQLMLVTRYDWAGGIAADTFEAFNLPELAGLVDRWWGWVPGADRPGHVVCSSLASWVYGKLGLDRPAVPAEVTTPGDWWTYNERHGNAS
jgi:hypothetical protein